MKKTSRFILLLILVALFNITFSPEINAIDNNTTNSISITFEDMINGNFKTLLIDNYRNRSFSITITYYFNDVDSIDFYASYTVLDNNIFTPNGTNVYGGAGANVLNITCDIPEEVIEDIQYKIDNIYGNTPYFDQKEFITYSFNCHSYAWYSRIFKTNVWIDNPSAYFSETDKSYYVIDTDEDELRVGDIVCYYTDGSNTHSAIITGFTGEEPDDSVLGLNTLIVESKWHMASLCQHRGDYSPYTEQTDQVIYYRLRTHSSHTIPDNAQDFEIECTIDSYSTDILETYHMYELNVESAGKYMVQIDSEYPVTGYILNINRDTVARIQSDNFEVNLNEGIYYLRVAFDTDNVGEINTYFTKHVHSYDSYTPINETCSVPICACGYKFNSQIQHSYTCGYVMIDNTYHAPVCDCGIIDNNSKTTHTVDGSYTDPIDNFKYGKCKFCGARFQKTAGKFPIIKQIPDDNITYTE